MLAVLLALACRPAPPDGPVNVLLVTLDTTRADHLSAYGYIRPTTPHLRALAERSLTFDAAWAPMATTLPSHTSLMTGVWPLEHGVLSNVEHGGRRLVASEAIVPAAQLFADAGYATAAFVSAAPLHRGTGIERGFATFDQGDRVVRPGRVTTEAALGWLREHVREPFFLWVHDFDPHGPFDPPRRYDRFRRDPTLDRWLAQRRIPEATHRAGGAPMQTAEAHDGYDGELLEVDDHVQRLLDLLERRGVADRTIVVVVGDHGEGLGQHDVGGHGHVWREQLQVPLLVHVPWLPPRRIEAPVAMVDVLPTLLGLVDLPGADAWRARASGHDVLHEPSGPSLGLSSLRQAALGTAPQRALTVGRWRWLQVDGREQLYDLGTDGFELTDLAEVLPVHRQLLSRWADALEAAQRARGGELGAATAAPLSPEEVQALEALGYTAP
ncbi:MAG: sulfatase [Myxococcota bacterium]